MVVIYYFNSTNVEGVKIYWCFNLQAKPKYESGFSIHTAKVT